MQAYRPVGPMNSSHSPNPESHSRSTALETALLADFQHELAMVQEQMRASTENLDSPLDSLVGGKMMETFPPLFAAVVLATAAASQTDDAVLERRIYLASALQMLYVALTIHKTLLVGVHEDDPIDGQDKTVTGGTILAGDYCFSQAAGMAAKTNSPKIVTIFAQALKTVSEGNLRRLHRAAAPAQEKLTLAETVALIQSGIQAAAHLVRLEAMEEETISQLGQQLAAAYSLPAAHASRPEPAVLSASLLEQLSSPRQQRWRKLSHLFAQ